jgi:lipopolysaccharide export system protein LptA
MLKTRRALIGAVALACWTAAGTLPGQVQNATSSSGFQLDGGEPIEVESDRLEVRDRENIAIFSGNVTLIQGRLLLRTIKMTVYYSGEGGGGGPTAGGADIERVEAEGRVYLKQDTQVATGDHGSFDMASGVMVLTGKEVVLTEGENVVVGCKLTSNMNTGLSQLDGCGRDGAGGRVKMLLQPGSQNR